MDKNKKSVFDSMSDLDRSICKKLQFDLPMAERPFRKLAEELNISESKVISRIRKFKKIGIIKKVRALLKHQKVGYRANIMVVWKVPEKKIAQTARICCKFKQISHCYERVTYPDWKYNLYTMIHGGSRNECEKVVKSIKAAAKIADYKLLPSGKEYKKVSAVYFK